MIQPRDSFQNLCLTSSFVESTNYVDLDLYHSVVKQVLFISFHWSKSLKSSNERRCSLVSNTGVSVLYVKQNYWLKA